MQRLIVWLVCLGLLPFALLVPFVAQPLVSMAFQAYSLAILCFIAGSWWSTALIAPGVTVRQRNITLISCNAMAVLGVLCTLLQSATSFLLMGVLFLVQVVAERSQSAFRGQPDYYRHLRLAVTAGVAGLHGAAWLVAGGLV